MNFRLFYCRAMPFLSKKCRFRVKLWFQKTLSDDFRQNNFCKSKKLSTQKSVIFCKNLPFYHFFLSGCSIIQKLLTRGQVHSPESGKYVWFMLVFWLQNQCFIWNIDSVNYALLQIYIAHNTLIGEFAYKKLICVMMLILYFTQINISIRNIFISPFAQKYTYAHCVDKYADNNQQRFAQFIHLMCVNCSGKVKKSVFYRSKMKVI